MSGSVIVVPLRSGTLDRSASTELRVARSSAHGSVWRVQLERRFQVNTAAMVPTRATTNTPAATHGQTGAFDRRAGDPASCRPCGRRPASMAGRPMASRASRRMESRSPRAMGCACEAVRAFCRRYRTRRWRSFRPPASACRADACRADDPPLFGARRDNAGGSGRCIDVAPSRARRRRAQLRCKRWGRFSRGRAMAGGAP
jgi:hypothetical protein